MTESEALHAQVAAAIDGARGFPVELALALAELQRRHNPAYAALWDGPVRRVEDIPAVPVALFRDLPLTSFPPERARFTFRTSGTTGQIRGVHRLLDDAMYRRAATTWLRRRLPDAPTGHIVSLCPPGSVDGHPTDSSLGHMLELFGGRVEGFFHDGALDTDGVWRALSGPGPVFLAATAFALDALLASGGAARLGPDSVLMVTGGFKGREVRLDAEGLYLAVPAALGGPRVVGEYGMTELSSQLWTDPVPAGGIPGAYRAPPWMFVYAVDPVTTAPVAGEGLLRFVDLANVHSVLAIETMDLGVVTRDPEGDRVELRGRVSGADARGCSLRAEDLLLRSRSPATDRPGPAR